MNENMKKCRVYYRKNKERELMKRKIYAQQNKVKISKRNRLNHLKKYGITEDEYNQLYQKQNECCAICGKHQSKLKRKLNIDHDHSTGEIRGLLCPKCNTALPLIENKKWIEKTYEYLSLNNKQTQRIKELESQPRCPCGGKLEGTGYDTKTKDVVFDCNKCGAQLILESKMWQKILKG